MLGLFLAWVRLVFWLPLTAQVLGNHFSCDCQFCHRGSSLSLLLFSWPRLFWGHPGSWPYFCSVPEQTDHLPWIASFCLLGDQVNGLFARQGSLSDVPWFGLLRFVHSFVLLFSLLVLTSLGGFFSLNNALSDRTFVFVIQFLSLTRLVFLTFFVRGSCGLDFHVSCPLAWTFFSELLPHSGGISPWRRVTQGTLFSWVPSSVSRPGC